MKTLLVRITLLIVLFAGCKSRDSLLQAVSSDDDLGYVLIDVKPDVDKVKLTTKTASIAIYFEDDIQFEDGSPLNKLKRSAQENQENLKPSMFPLPGGIVEKFDKSIILPLVAHDLVNLPLVQNEATGLSAIRFKDLFVPFKTCPISFSKGSPGFEFVSRSLGGKEFNVTRTKIDTNEGLKEAEEAGVVTSAIIDTSRLSLGYSCVLDLGVQGEEDRNELRVDVILEHKTEQPLFSVPSTDQGFKPYHLCTKGSSRRQNCTTPIDGKGTSFFFVQMNDKSTPVLRWNLRRRNIVINDKANAKIPGQGNEHVVFALKRAVSSIKKAIPEIGHRIKFSSEVSEPANVELLTIKFDSLGSGSKLFDTSNGEVYKAGIFVNPDVKENRTSLSKKFKEWNLTTDPVSDTNLFIDFLVFHEFGHVLGLRHNFVGWKVQEASTVHLFSVMSYAMHMLPFSLSTLTAVDYLEHDILSLKFLYADLIDERDPELLRRTLLPKINQMEFLTDDDSFSQMVMLERVQDFYQTGTNQELVKLRTKMNPKEIIKKILE